MSRDEFGALIAHSYQHWNTVVEAIHFQKM